MSGLPITIATWEYDRVRGIRDGSVPIEGCEVTHLHLRPKETFFRLFEHQAFDVSEMSFSSYMLARNDPKMPYVALPIPLSRVFTHSGIFIRSDRGIETPEDLKGRIVGAPNYHLTRGLCIRGMLSDEYGVQPADMSWRIAGVDVPENLNYVGAGIPDGVEVLAAPQGATLSQMLIDGEIDAIFTAQTPDCWRRRAPNVARLFPDYRAAELAYYRKTGIYHIMHLIGLRRSLAKKYPWLPQAVVKGFTDAKKHIEPNLTDTSAMITMLPWLTAEAEATIRDMGADYWPYGIRKNGKTIDAQIRWSYEQGLSKKQWAIDELFHPSTID